MTKGNDNASKPGARDLVEHLWAGFLKSLGGQDLRNSGFENEEPDLEFSGGDESWHN
jgi:hypothetical protein